MYSTTSRNASSFELQSLESRQLFSAGTMLANDTLYLPAGNYADVAVTEQVKHEATQNLSATSGSNNSSGMDIARESVLRPIRPI